MAGARARLLADAAALARPRRCGGGAEPGARRARYGRGRSAHLVGGEVGGDAIERHEGGATRRQARRDDRSDVFDSE